MYLTFGILQWYEDKTSETPRFAPLLFLPIEINKSSWFRWLKYFD
ncbi:DUF4011 domain-containing protein [Mycoplasmopsis cynos]